MTRRDLGIRAGIIYVSCAVVVLIIGVMLVTAGKPDYDMQGITVNQFLANNPNVGLKCPADTEVANKLTQEYGTVNYDLSLSLAGQMTTRYRQAKGTINIRDSTKPVIVVDVRESPSGTRTSSIRIGCTHQQYSTGIGSANERRMDWLLHETADNILRGSKPML